MSRGGYMRMQDAHVRARAASIATEMIAQLGVENSVAIAKHILPFLANVVAEDPNTEYGTYKMVTGDLIKAETLIQDSIMRFHGPSDPTTEKA